MENTGNIGFKETLWKSADKLRGSMDASEYKYVERCPVAGRND